MKNEAYKLAQLHAKQETVNRLLDLLSTPPYSIVLSFMLIEAAQAVKLGDKHLMGGAAGAALEVGLAAGPVLVALANSDILKGLLAAKTGGVSAIPDLLGSGS